MSNPDTDLADAVRVGVLRGYATTFDQQIRQQPITPVEQLNLCFLLTGSAMARIVEAGRVAGKPLNRGQKHRLIKSSLDDMERIARIAVRFEGDDDPSHDTGGE